MTTFEQFKSEARVLIGKASAKREKVAVRKQAFAKLEDLFLENGYAMPAEIKAIGQELEKNRERGVCDMVRELVMDKETYPSWKDVVSAVKEAFPNAQTSTKSVASIARDMRKLGIDVPHRTAVAGPPKLTATGAEAIDALDGFDESDLEDETEE
jgi:hypothetical protein